MRILFILVLLWTFPVLAQVFLPGTEDIPLMDGMSQVEELASFDNPEERMVLVGAVTKLSPKKILKFYQENLTNLGWTEKKAGFFERGTDSFSIEITTQGENNQIQFRLSQSN